MTGSRRATAVVWASVTALSVAGAVLTVLAWGDLKTQDAVSNLSGAPAAVLYATLGALVVRRAGNVIGWLLLGEGAGLAIMSLASAYAVLGITHPGTLPAPELVGLLAEWSFIPVLAGARASCCCCSRPGRCRLPAGARSRDWACWPPR